MNRSQWNVLSIFSYLLGFLFVKISLQWKGFCATLGGGIMSNSLTCIRGEIFAPYPYIFFTLGFVFLILAWLEPKKKWNLKQDQNIITEVFQYFTFSYFYGFLIQQLMDHLLDGSLLF